jgi:cytochrome b
MFGKTKDNFWLDVTIFTLFLATALTGLLLWLVLPDGRGSGNTIFLGLTRNTWIDLHNWVGLAMLAGVTLHLVLHWKWITCVSRRYFKKLARQARINFSLNSLLFVAFFLVNISGLIVWLVLPSGGYQGGRNPFYNATIFTLTRHGWKDLHLWVGLALIVILTIHLVLHWQWVTCVARRYTRAALCQSDECAVA